MQLTVPGMPDASSTTESLAVAPVATSSAPAALTLFAQPWPADPKFEHGHGVVTAGSIPSPAQNEAPGVVSSITTLSTRMKSAPFGDPGPTCTTTRSNANPPSCTWCCVITLTFGNGSV